VSAAVEVVFWLAVAVCVYAYLGYGLVITLLARLRPRPVRSDDAYRPTVSLIICAYNEEKVIAEKLENSLALAYPADRLEILVVSDGSTDGTARLVEAYGARLTAPRIVSLHQPERRGKPAAANRAASLASGDILVFSDANSMYTPDSIARLVRHFADPIVGCVAGEKRIVEAAGERVSHQAGLYWRYESYLKRMDSTVWSVVGAAGEIMAVRRSVFTPPEPDSFIEDFILSMRIAERGYRVIYEPDAISLEEAPAADADEFERKARIAAGGFQSIVRLRGLLHPRHGVLAFEYISHRVLRWAVVPLLLPLLLVANLALLPSRPLLYGLTLLGQALLYGAAALGMALPNHRLGRLKLVSIPTYFVVMNLAVLAGLYRYLGGKQQVTWKKVARAAGNAPAARPAGGAGQPAVTERLLPDR
jgi:cellulose synthase/poly-beta-1,6-N-acetylglucosamine synthase-like glycosyltransferase